MFVLTELISNTITFSYCGPLSDEKKEIMKYFQASLCYWDFFF